MKAMLIAFAAIIVLTISADIAFDSIGFSSSEMTAGDAVRLK